jgi:hypothetical protein
MVAGQEIEVHFLVLESALNRVRDAFGTSPRFQGTKETEIVPKDRLNHNKDISRERLVKFAVKTTHEEAFRWALANADVVELVHPQDVRDRLGRIADPIHKTYARTLVDRVRENIDYIRETGMFKITMNIDEDTAFETFKELEKQGEVDIVDKIHIAKLEGETGDYFGDFVNAKVLNVVLSPNCTNIMWASKLTKVVSLAIHETQISDASWLKVMEGLGFVEITNTPICDLSALSEHKRIRNLEINNTKVSDISFIEGYKHLKILEIVGCPIDDYTPLLKIPPLDALRIDENAVEALGLESLVKRHPNANIVVQQRVDN